MTRALMVDIVDKLTRSKMMAGIRAKNTQPELALRRAVHARGYRFRLHSRLVCGRPDLVFAKHRAAVFVHGCFWHRHQGCRYATNPSTRSEFWRGKFEVNQARDRTVQIALLQDGWRVATVWECALRKVVLVGAVVDLLSIWIESDEDQISIGESEVTSE